MHDADSEEHSLSTAGKAFRLVDHLNHPVFEVFFPITLNMFPSICFSSLNSHSAFSWSVGSLISINGIS